MRYFTFAYVLQYIDRDTNEWSILHGFVWSNILAVWHRWVKYFYMFYVGEYIGGVTLVFLWCSILAVWHRWVKYIHVLMCSNISAVSHWWVKNLTCVYVKQYMDSVILVSKVFFTCVYVGNILALWHRWFSIELCINSFENTFCTNIKLLSCQPRVTVTYLLFTIVK